VPTYDISYDAASFDSWHRAQEYLLETCGDRYAIPPLARKVSRASCRGAPALKPGSCDDWYDFLGARRPCADRPVCGVTPVGSLGGPWQGKFAVRWLAPDLGAVLSTSGHGDLLERADAVAASAATAAGQITARTERMTAMLARGRVTFSDLERYVYPLVVHDVIPWASRATVHLLEALQSGAARPAVDGFQLTGAPG